MIAPEHPQIPHSEPLFPSLTSMHLYQDSAPVENPSSDGIFEATQRETLSISLQCEKD